MRAASALVAGLVASLLAACNSSEPGLRAPAIADAVQVGTLADRELIEASAITPSAVPGVFWLLNDSGNAPLLFAMDSTGAARARVRIPGVQNRDWEAIASGPCSAGHCLYVGDVGDNQARRPYVTVFRIAEPAIDLAGAGAGAGRSAAVSVSESMSTPPESLSFTYPDGPHDVEAMWVSPDTTMWVVTKRPMQNRRRRLRQVLLFRVTAEGWHAAAGTRVRAELVDSLPIIPANGNESNWVTDAAFTRAGPDGPSVVVRTYQEALVFNASPTTGRPGSVRARCSLRELHERSGEAVAWLPDGRLLFANEGKISRLWTGRC